MMLGRSDCESPSSLLLPYNIVASDCYVACSSNGPPRKGGAILQAKPTADVNNEAGRVRFCRLIRVGRNIGAIAARIAMYVNGTPFPMSVSPSSTTAFGLDW